MEANQHEAPFEGATPADSSAERWTIRPGETRTITLEGVQRLKVGVVAGSVDVVGHDEPWARVEVHRVDGRDLEVSLDDGALAVAHPLLRWSNLVESLKSLGGDRGRVEVSILVPRGTRLTYGQVSAEALVSGLVSGGDVSTVSGAVQLDGVVGALQVNTVSGDVEATGVDGDLQVHSVSGDVTVSGASSRIGVDTVSGDVLLDLHGPVRSVSLNGVSSDATIRVDQGVAAEVATNTVSGSGSVFGTRMPKRGGRHSEPGVGEPARVSINTVSGDHTVVRR
jgi:hypothetical protein